MPTLNEILTTIEQREEVIADVQDTVAQDWKHFSTELAKELRKRGLSHAKFAKQIGIHESRLCRILAGKRRWSFTLARKAIAALNPSNGN